jgi:hypothetical protein
MVWVRWGREKVRKSEKNGEKMRKIAKNGEDLVKNCEKLRKNEKNATGFNRGGRRERGEKVDVICRN